MGGATNVYVVFYGDWPAASGNLINNYLQHLDGTTYYIAITNYSDTTGAHVQNVVNYNPVTNSIRDNYSLGKTLVDADVQTLVSNAIAVGQQTAFEAPDCGAVASESPADCARRKTAPDS